MEIRVRELTKERVIKVTGEEPWLSKIYDSFAEPPEGIKPKINSIIELKFCEEGEISLKGHLTYQPYVRCSRCDDLIPWDIDVEFDVIFKEAKPIDQKNYQLTKEELDIYFIENGVIDLELFLNEQVMLAIPSRTRPQQDENNRCVFCHKDLSCDLVSGTNNIKNVSQFNVLKKAKQKLKSPRQT